MVSFLRFLRENTTCIRWIYKILKKANVSYSAQQDEQRQQRNLKIVERYLTGQSHAQIAKAFGLSVTTIPGILANAGVRGRRDKLTTPDMIQNSSSELDEKF